MEGTTNFWTLIGNSIFHNDLYILIAAVTAFILFLITMTITNSLKNDIDKNIMSIHNYLSSFSSSDDLLKILFAKIEEYQFT